MKKIAILLSSILIGSFTCFGALLDVDLSVRFSYADMDLSCVVSGVFPEGVSVTGTLADGKLVQATLWPIGDRSDRLDLLPDELAGIETKVDPLGDPYITTLPLNPRLLVWIIFHIDKLSPFFGGCQPPMGFATLGPYGYTFKFKHDTPNNYFSPIQAFSGNRLDNTPYAIKLGFFQRQMDQ